MVGSVFLQYSAKIILTFNANHKTAFCPLYKLHVPSFNDVDGLCIKNAFSCQVARVTQFETLQGLPSTCRVQFDFGSFFLFQAVLSPTLNSKFDEVMTYLFKL